MRRPGARTTLAPAVLASVLGLTACGGDGDSDEGAAPPATSSAPASPSTSADPTPEPTPSPTSEDPPAGTGGRPAVVGTIASGLDAPWGLAFLPDGDAVLTERDTTRVLRVSGGGTGTGRAARGEVTELGTLDLASPGGEGGLLGVAASPDFASDGLLYLYATTDSDNRVVRVRLTGDRLGEPEPVLTGIPRGQIHDGGRLLFDAEGMLLVSTGEAGEPERAQDPDDLGGKILRITPDGDPAPGNPDPASPVLSLGHRNVQGLAVDAAGALWASEFGASTFDELNLVTPGANHGWPAVEGRGDAGTRAEGFVDPVRQWSTDDASPSGLAFADGALWMGALRGERLWRVPVTGAGATPPK